jgi:hypothetical protein
VTKAKVKVSRPEFTVQNNFKGIFSKIYTHTHQADVEKMAFVDQSFLWRFSRLHLLLLYSRAQTICRPID